MMPQAFSFPLYAFHTAFHFLFLIALTYTQKNYSNLPPPSVLPLRVKRDKMQIWIYFVYNEYNNRLRLFVLYVHVSVLSW